MSNDFNIKHTLKNVGKSKILGCFICALAGNNKARFSLSGGIASSFAVYVECGNF